MKKIFIYLSVIALALSSCKSKLEKKDKSLEEMQNQDSDTSKYKPILASADETPVYKKINDTTEMHLNIYYPRKHKKKDSTPAIIYFFGGAFINGSPEQFENSCIYFASRGMVAISADYRVISRNKGNGLQCIYDAKSAVRYVREHAEDFGIDPNKIAIGGGSAGGMLALECAVDDTNWQDKSDNTSVSSRPDAIILLNPVVNSEEFPFRIRKFKDNDKDPDSISHAKEINPLTHIHGGMPPAIIFHGTADKISSFKYITEFKKKYEDAGNQIEFHSYPKQKHGFTAEKYANGKFYKETLKLTDEFLIKLGYLTGTPTVEIDDTKPTGNAKSNDNPKRPVKKKSE